MSAASPNVTVLSGGVGAARFLRGLLSVVDATDVTAIVNTGDDTVLHGLTISPDLVKDGDVEMLQDLTMAALAEARRKVEEKLKGQLGGMLPPGMGF